MWSISQREYVSVAWHIGSRLRGAHVRFAIPWTRWNTRKMGDGQRVARAIKQIDGKRLEYRESVENPPYLPKPQAQMKAPFGSGAVSRPQAYRGVSCLRCWRHYSRKFLGSIVIKRLHSHKHRDVVRTSIGIYKAYCVCGRIVFHGWLQLLYIKPVDLRVGRDSVGVKPVDLVDEFVGDEILGADLLLYHAPLEQKIQVLGASSLGAFSPACHPGVLQPPIRDARLQHLDVIADCRSLIFSGWLSLRKDLIQHTDGSLGIIDCEDGALGIASCQSDSLFPAGPERLLECEEATAGVVVDFPRIQEA